ncbi:hypothetical protein FB550_10131 [Neobacillus bataviensis]|uniref:Uncharacterized protein n=1 Tax=Neobacillus bataviensis TaxID=220685 RepID=A0A561DXG0_9BACI|nr:hypothetical protein FB550_10131 [Neobacillus bataviensis]
MRYLNNGFFLLQQTGARVEQNVVSAAFFLIELKNAG